MEEKLFGQKIVPKKEIVEYAAEKRLLIDDGAINLLQTQEDYKKLLDAFLEKNEFILSEGKLSKELIKKDTKISEVEEVVIKKTGFKPLAKEFESNLRILDEYNITEKESHTEGKIDDFLHVFRDKFGFLENVLKRRPGLNAKNISSLKRVQKGSEIDVIGMVREKWISKNGHFIFLVEDLETSCMVLILKDDIKNMQLSQHILLDDVLGIKASKLSDDMIILKEAFWPDLPQRQSKTAQRDLAIASFSDIHVGSKLFLEKEFSKVISWLNGSVGSEKELEEVGKIKYLAIAGDTVDGIGVYPSQGKELAIKDIYKQYDVLSDFLEQIPEYIEIIICPGNHDAVRRAEPQPPLPKEFVPRLYDMKNVHLVSSPDVFEVEGLKAMMYHGSCLNDVFSALNLSYSQPEKAIVEALKRRNLMPVYGMRNPYIPEKRNHMLIREEPDIYFGGDNHHNGYTKYRGTTIINNGTFQARTNFQIEMGHVPTPGIVPVYNLKTGTLKENYFIKKEEENESF